MESFTAVYRRNSVVVPALRESNSLYQNGYGSLLGEEDVLTLTPCETLFLVERGKLSVLSEETRELLSFNELLTRFIALDRLIWTRYLVYRDLRTKGFIVREGYGLGVDFLVYERGAFGTRPPTYLVFGVWEGEPKEMGELMDILKFAMEKGKILKIAVIDRIGEVVYYALQELALEGEEMAEEGPRNQRGGGP
ncbi:MAG: tRNA-intron lyase [Candidatus Bathyarchaeia archaeon]